MRHLEEGSGCCPEWSQKKALFLLGKNFIKTLWVKSEGDTDLAGQATVITPVEFLPEVEQTSLKTQGPQMAAVYVLICLCYMVPPSLFGTLVLLIK